MIALSIRQPWAWLIIHAGKDIENRSWPTTVRGPVLVHASKGMTVMEYKDAACWAEEALGILVPPRDQLQFGGIIGQVEIADSVWASKSPWFSGPYGFVLRNPKPMPFREVRGQLGFFEVEV